MSVVVEFSPRAAEPAPRDRRPVDLAHLARYTLGDGALEREVLRLFRTQARLYLRRLSEAADAQAWRDAAHILKGSARGIGAWGVAAAAESAEVLDGAAPADEQRRLAETVRRQVEDAIRFIDDLLADP